MGFLDHLHWHLPQFRQGSISVLLIAFALSFGAGGILKNVRPIRFVGLIFFAAVIFLGIVDKCA